MIYLGGKLLESSDADGSLLRGVEVAAADTEIRRRADHAARESEWIVGEDRSSCTIVVLTNATHVQLDISKQNKYNTCHIPASVVVLKLNCSAEPMASTYIWHVRDSSCYKNGRR